MKIMKLLLIGLVFLVSVSMSYAVPEIAYTNFARTAGGNLVIGPPATVDVRITILNSGVQVYQEIHQDVPTNGYGLFTVKLGTGTPVGLDTYSSIVAVNTLNVQAETDAGDGYRFVQLSPLLNTALKNEEAAGIVTLNDAYLNGDSIEVLPGMPIKLQGTGLIQSDATIAAINSNNKNLTTKEYVDNGIANVADNPFLVYQNAAAELPNSKILNGEAGVINFNAATANLSIIDEGISEAKLKIPTPAVNGYILKWNGSDMTWADPTVITAHPVVGDGTAANPITLYKTGVNANEVLFFNGTQWTNGKVTTPMITDANVTGPKLAAAVAGNGLSQNVNGNLDVNVAAPVIFSGDNVTLDFDATLDLNGGKLSINTGNANEWTALQTFSSVDINGGTIDGTVIGATAAAAGTFTNLTVTGLSKTDSLYVVKGAYVGGNTTTGGEFIGKLDKQITGGNGLANLTFDNTADVAFAVNVDNSTLEINADTLRVKANGITTLELAPNAVITENILDGNVTEPKLAMTNDAVEGHVIRWNTTAGGLTWEEASVYTAAPVSGDGTSADPITLDYVMPFILNGTDLDLEYDATLLVDATTGLGFDHNHMNTWLTTQTFAPTVNETALLVDGTNATSGYSFMAIGSGIYDGITDFYYEGDSYQDGFAYFNNASTTRTSFAVQAYASGEDATVPGFPSVAQGMTAIGHYTGAAPSMNMAIGSVGLAYAGAGSVAIGSYGGARDNNVVANVGVVGHAVTDASAKNHGIFGMVSQDVTGGTEIATAISWNINSAVTGINMGSNPNDWAAYFYGNVNATKYYGALQYSIIDGPGIKDFTFNNSGNATVEVDYDATLKIDGSDLLGFDLAHSNLWTGTQFLPANADQGNNLVAAVNMATDMTLEADVLMYDATLEVNGNNLGFNHDHQNTWLTSQFFAPVPDQPAVVITGTATGEGLVVDGQLTVNTATVVAVGSGAGDANIDFMFQDGDMDLMGSLSVSDNTTTNTLDVTTTANVGTDLTVGGLTTTNTLDVTTTANVGTDLTVGNDAAVGGNLVVTGTTTSALFIGETNFDIQDGAGIADFTFNNLADAVVSVNVAAPVIITADNVTLDYDVTLDLNAGKLSINTANENTWTADQLLNATATQGDNLVAAINMAADMSLEADVLMYDATLEVIGHNLGIDLDHENIWAADQLLNATATQGDNLVAAVNMAADESVNGDVINIDNTLEVNGNELGFNHDNLNVWNVAQTFAPTSNDNALVIDGTNSVSGNALVAVGNGISGDFDFLFEGDFEIIGSITLYDNISIGLDASVGNDLDVTGNTTTGSLDVNDYANIGGDFDVTGNTTLDGHVAIGSDNADAVVFNAQVDSDIVPDENNVHSLGSSTLRWNDLYLGPGTLHIGNDLDEGTISYDVANDEFDFNQNINVDGNANFTGDVDVTGTLTAGTLNGAYTEGSVLFADAGGNIAENNGNLFWDNNNGFLSINGNIPVAVLDLYPANPMDVLLNLNGSVDASPDAFIVGEVLISDGNTGTDGNFELQVQGGDGIIIDDELLVNNHTATLRINNYSYPAEAGAASEFMALNAATDQLEWWNYDSTIVVDVANKTIGFNTNTPISFSSLVGFNPSSGPAATFTSVDSTEATVKIENTDKQGVALELIGKTEETTALEITTGGLNIGAGQFIVSSNSGVTGVEPNGPSVTINNNGDGATENGGALEILVGHTTFSYGNYAPGNNFAVDLSGEPYTVLDVESDGTNAVTLPGTDMAATKAGTIIYVINSGTGTLTLPGTLGSVNAGTSAQLVYTAAGWFRLN